MGLVADLAGSPHQSSADVGRAIGIPMAERNVAEGGSRRRVLQCVRRSRSMPDSWSAGSRSCCWGWGSWGSRPVISPHRPRGAERARRRRADAALGAATSRECRGSSSVVGPACRSRDDDQAARTAGRGLAGGAGRGRRTAVERRAVPVHPAAAPPGDRRGADRRRLPRHLVPGDAGRICGPDLEHAHNLHLPADPVLRRRCPGARAEDPARRDRPGRADPVGVAPAGEGRGAGDRRRRDRRGRRPGRSHRHPGPGEGPTEPLPDVPLLGRHPRADARPLDRVRPGRPFADPEPLCDVCDRSGRHLLYRVSGGEEARSTGSGTGRCGRRSGPATSACWSWIAPRSCSTG